MREMMKVFKVCALALAVLSGTASISAAAKKGPTGKTRRQCFSDFNDCRIKCKDDCYQLIDIGDAIKDCLSCKCLPDCDVELIFCLPQRNSNHVR